MSCKIRTHTASGKREFIPVLTQRCKGQHRTKGSKCFDNQCFKPKKLLSENSGMGNVVLINIPNAGDLIVKWNQEPEEVNEMIYEIKIQNAAYSIGLAPKIINYYREEKHMYIFMENLIAKGYRTLWDIYYQNGTLNIPKGARRAIAEALLRLNKLGLAHRDIHAENVFYNPNKPKGKQIIFIDFGLAKHYPTMWKAVNRDIDKIIDLSDDFYEGGENFMGISLQTNWKSIKDILWDLALKEHQPGETDDESDSDSEDSSSGSDEDEDSY